MPFVPARRGQLAPIADKRKSPPAETKFRSIVNATGLSRTLESRYQSFARSTRHNSPSDHQLCNQ